MNKAELENTILGVLYKAYFTSDQEVDLSLLREPAGWEEKDFKKLLSELTYFVHIREVNLGQSYRLDKIGIDLVEAKGLVPDRAA